MRSLFVFIAAFLAASALGGAFGGGSCAPLDVEDDASVVEPPKK